MKKRFQRILDQMTYLLNEVGISYDLIKREPQVYRTQMKCYQQTIRSEKDGQSFEIIVQATSLAKPKKHQGMPLPRFHHLSFDWSIGFSVPLSNNHSNLTLKLTKETTKNKLEKLFWQRDLEVFEELFDANFWIESNTTYAYGMLLDGTLQEQLLANLALFGTLEIQQNRIYYTGSLLEDEEKALEAGILKKHHKSMLAICLNLAKKVEIWEPPLGS